MDIVSVEQMKAIESKANAGGLSYDQMMRNAGEGIANWICQNVNPEKGVVGLIGSGNNGGDTIIALTKLASLGFRSLGFLLNKRQDDPLLADFVEAGGALVELFHNENIALFQAALTPKIIILDGILGTGIRLPIRGELKKLMGSLHDILEDRTDIHIIAVDCPSGLDCDTGEVSEVSFMANDTLYMAAVKQGLLVPPGRIYAGDLSSIDIGIRNISEISIDALPMIIDKKYCEKILPERPGDGHKWTFGTCLVIAGSRSYTGAAYLTGKAAYRSGCGLVHMVSIDSVQEALAGKLVEAVWSTIPGKNSQYDPAGINLLKGVLEKADAIVIGPGWGLGDLNLQFLSGLLESLPQTLPTLFDADALKLLGKISEWWKRVPENSLLTPHPGELSALTGLSISEIQSNRWKITQKFAMQWGVTLLLKGAVPVISTQEGQLLIHPVCDSILATAGSGDVLSGLIGGFLAQSLSVSKAAALGTCIQAKTAQILKSRPNKGTATALDILDLLTFE